MDSISDDYNEYIDDYHEDSDDYNVYDDEGRKSGSEMSDSERANNDHNIEDVITIESDNEEDARIREENRQIRLIPDGRVGRPRDVLNRFVNSSGTNRPMEEREINQGHNTNNNNDNDDDIEIISAIDRPERINGPIDPNSDYIDLDEEERNPNTGLNPMTIATQPDGATPQEVADGVTIVGERTTLPSVILNLPGGEQLRLDATARDAPMRSSFEWAEGLPEQRSRLLRRSGRNLRRRGRTLFEPISPAVPSTDLSSYLPVAVRSARRRLENNIRNIQRNVQRPRADYSDTSSDSPEMTQIRREISSYPPDVRSAFDHAETIGEFRSIIQNVAPVTWDECGDDLSQLYVRYRSSHNSMNRWSMDRVQSINNSRPSPLRQQVEARSNNTAMTGGTNPYEVGRNNVWGGSPAEMLRRAGLLDDEDDEDYRPRGFYMTEADRLEAERREEERTQNIINMIQAREENERDKRVKLFMEGTKAQEKQYHDKADKLPDGFSSNFDTIPKVKVNVVKNGKQETLILEDNSSEQEGIIEVPSCTLCGSELGIGIPDSFEGLNQKDKGVSFEYLVEEYGFSCPYQSLLKPTQLDRDLSRRTYVAACGHTYCGRCYVRIENAKSKRKMTKKKLATLYGSSNPNNYGPTTCPAEGCTSRLRTKGKMREMYL